MTTQRTEDEELTTEVTTPVEDTEEEVPNVTAEATESEEVEEDDPFEAWKAEFEKNRAAELRKELEEKARQEFLLNQQSAAKAQQEAAARERMKTSFGTAAQLTAGMLKKLEVYDQEGQKLEFDDSAIQTFIQPWQQHNSVVQQAEESRIYEQLAETIYTNLPKDAQDSFAERAHGKPLAQYVKEFGESYAKNSDAYKALQAEMEEKVKAAEARGIAKGQKTPKGTAGTVEQHSTNRSTEPVDKTTLVGIARARNAGHIDDNEFRELYAKIRNKS